jgi:hypothetical protein
MSNNDMGHMQYLSQISGYDISHIDHKEKTYQGSWKKRGGIGAAMMMLRKIDRIEVMLKEVNYDVFKACSGSKSGDDGTMLAEIRDLRRYLLLIESEVWNLKAQKPLQADLLVADKVVDQIIGHIAEGFSQRPGTPEDGGHHARQIEE